MSYVPITPATKTAAVKHYWQTGNLQGTADKLTTPFADAGCTTCSLGGRITGAPVKQPKCSARWIDRV